MSNTELHSLITEAERTLAQSDRVWANTSNNPLPTVGVTASLRALIPALSSLLNRIEDREELGDAIDSVGEYIPGTHADDYINPDKAAAAVIAYLLPEESK